MLPFGLADTLFSTLDLPTFWRTAVITAREMISNLLHGMCKATLVNYLQGNFDSIQPYTACLL